MHMTTTGFYFFPTHGQIVIGGTSYDTVFPLAFIAVYYHTFLVLAYHYVYRYKTVTRGFVNCFAGNWPKSRWIIIGVVVYVMYIAGFVGTCSIAFTPTAETRIKCYSS
ncbi:hypothetical protein PENTCL1PPCAC_30209 [Pristionchus entomophagus]|uniref:G protein-coupled receptor n=1 Tax=Pristionchus entomophagus TaxID=358040 RepID=A0AAV5UPA3_9BILA|nr:hypothetical protein PENTCL1PPCAC_30209 [Pristionchus entomophagus]